MRHGNRTRLRRDRMCSCNRDKTGRIGLRQRPCQVPNGKARFAHQRGLTPKKKSFYANCHLGWAPGKPHLRRSHSQNADGRFSSQEVFLFVVCEESKTCVETLEENIFFWSAPKTGPKKLQSQTQSAKMDHCPCCSPNTRALSWIHMQQCMPSKF